MTRIVRRTSTLKYRSVRFALSDPDAAGGMRSDDDL